MPPGIGVDHRQRAAPNALKYSCSLTVGRSSMADDMTAAARSARDGLGHQHGKEFFGAREPFFLLGTE
jgi:hypothetical protein